MPLSTTCLARDMWHGKNQINSSSRYFEKMINVGVIGLGRQGMLHLMVSSRLEGVKVVAAADNSKKALKKAESIGVRNTYQDYKNMLKNATNLGLDSVIISLPNFLHFESIQLSLDSGLNVFVEKPLATTVEECSEIVKMEKKSGRIVMVGHVLRFTEAIEIIKEKLDNGSIGNLEVLTAEDIINGPFAHPRNPTPISDWWFDPKTSGGGALLDVGYHMIDLYRFFAGDANVDYVSLDYKFNLPIEDGAIVVLKSSNSDSSTKGIINIGWYQQTVFPRYNFRVILHGSAGYISSEELVPHNLFKHAIKIGGKNVLNRLVGRKIRPLYYTYHNECFYKELDHFFSCIRKDTNPSVSAVDGLKAVEIVNKAYRLWNQNSI
jgi:UDP-N-acetylglucosamine 3-dehydrogenase